jgi:hypothetical protein
LEEINVIAAFEKIAPQKHARSIWIQAEDAVSPTVLPVKKTRLGGDEPQGIRHRVNEENKSESDISERLARLERLLERQLQQTSRGMDGEDGTSRQQESEGAHPLEEEPLAPRRARNSIVGGGVRSHPLEADLSEEGMEARRVLEEYFGVADNFHPLTYRMQKVDREEITRTVESTEVFFPIIREIEIPMAFARFNENEKEKRLYNHVCFMKQMYELEMPVIFYLANGEMDMACKCAAQLVELTLDSASTANEQRFKLRSSPAMVNSISRVGEEPVFQEGYRAIAEEKAKEYRDIHDIVDGFPSNTQSSLPKRKAVRIGWVERTAHGETRVDRRPPQSRSSLTGSYRANSAYHQNTGNLGSGRNRQEQSKAQHYFKPKSASSQATPSSFQAKPSSFPYRK